MDCIYIAYVHTSPETSDEELQNLVENTRWHYDILSPIDGPDFEYKTCMIVFDHLDKNSKYSSIGYFDKLNHKILRELVSLLGKLEKSGAYFQMAVIYHSVNEALLRACVASNLIKKESFQPTDIKLFDKNRDLRFSDFIKTFNELDPDKDINKILLKYNRGRNELVHDLLSFNTLIELKKSSKRNKEMGHDIMIYLRQYLVEHQLKHH